MFHSRRVGCSAVGSCRHMTAHSKLLIQPPFLLVKGPDVQLCHSFLGAPLHACLASILLLPCPHSQSANLPCSLPRISHLRCFNDKAEAHGCTASLIGLPHYVIRPPHIVCKIEGYAAVHIWLLVDSWEGRGLARADKRDIQRPAISFSTLRS